MNKKKLVEALRMFKAGIDALESALTEEDAVVQKTVVEEIKPVMPTFNIPKTAPVTPVAPKTTPASPVVTEKKAIPPVAPAPAKSLFDDDEEDDIFGDAKETTDEEETEEEVDEDEDELEDEDEEDDEAEEEVEEEDDDNDDNDEVLNKLSKFQKGK